MAIFDLFRPKWKHSDPDVRIAAAQQLEDPNTLMQMAAGDREWFVRHRVFDVIRDKFANQTTYAFLARNSIDEEIRRKAVKLVSDVTVLEDIAKSEKYRYVRDAAEHRLEELHTNLWAEKSGAAKTAD